MVEVHSTRLETSIIKNYVVLKVNSVCIQGSCDFILTAPGYVLFKIHI